MFDFYPLFIHCINTQRGCHTLKLSQACYILRVVKPFLSWDTLKMIIVLTFILLWLIGKYFGEIPHTLIIFLGLKKINWIIMGARTRDSSRELSKILTILPLTSQCIFSLALSVVNKNLFKKNSQLPNMKTMKNTPLFQPSSHLTIYQKLPLYFGIKVSTKLPSQIKNLSSNVKQFNNFLQLHSFYTVVEYFSQNESSV